MLAPPRLRVSSRQFVALVSGLVVLLRLPGIPVPLHTDEAGYFLVAQSWRAGGPNLYGHYFVDRPPLLIALFRLADLTGWPASIRVLACVFSVMFVVAAAWAASEVTGARGIRWAAVVAGALATTPVLLAHEADGEIFAAPLVMLSVALTLAAVRRTGRTSFLLATGAGLAAGAAVMTKQNFVDAVVFAVVLLAAALWQRQLSWRDAARVAGGGALGGAMTVRSCAGLRRLVEGGAVGRVDRGVRLPHDGARRHRGPQPARPAETSDRGSWASACSPVSCRSSSCWRSRPCATG